MKRPYERKGEWLEVQGIKVESLHIPDKLLHRLQSEEGIRVAGNRLRLRLFPGEQACERGEWTELDVLYEDDFCLVVNKRAGLPVHPAREGEGGSLANAVAAYYEATGQEVRVRHIHRLDADTTGPVLYAKNEFAQAVLDEDMRHKRIGRYYIALVKGALSPAEGTIRLPIGK